MGFSQSYGKYFMELNVFKSVPDIEKNGILLEQALGKL